MKFEILTIFPELFNSYLDTGIMERAQREKLIDIKLHNIRVHTTDKHKTVDDTPYGGGAGMVMKIEPIDKTLNVVKKKESGSKKNKTVVLSARGQQFTQAKAQEYAKLDQLTLICGRYEGIDQRVADYLADEEVSIGPYVLNGGETAAMVVIEAVIRLIPGVLGNPKSLEEESFAKLKNATPAVAPPAGGCEGSENCKIIKEYPQYTKPAEYKGWKVPEVLLSGNHSEIAKWRSSQSNWPQQQPNNSFLSIVRGTPCRP